MGSVMKAGLYQLEGRKTLFEVLSLAGGIANDAGYSVIITRRREYGVVPLPNAKMDPTGEFSIGEVNLDATLHAANPQENIIILPHDVISVPRGDIVYVIGEVKKSGGYVLNNKKTITVLEALSRAEGLTPVSSPQKSKVLRAVSGQANRLEIPLKLNDIMAGKADNFVMVPDDILVVPTSMAKGAAQRTLQTAVSVALGRALYRY
jgi:polysaccharide export outer membrane protein